MQYLNGADLHALFESGYRNLKQNTEAINREYIRHYDKAVKIVELLAIGIASALYIPGPIYTIESSFAASSAVIGSSSISFANK